MTTAAPWAEFDEKLREQYKRRGNVERWRDISGSGDEALRLMLTDCEVADQELAELKKIVAETQAQIDEAADEHQRVTAPLQNELADIGTPAARKVELRAQVIEANESLESKIAALRKSLEACQVELDVTRSVAGGRAAIEHEWCRRGPKQNQRRTAALRKALELLRPVSFGFEKRIQESDVTLENLREEVRRRAAPYVANGRPPRATVKSDELREAEERHEKLVDVGEVIGAWQRDAEAELAEIHDKRLAELYE